MVYAHSIDGKPEDEWQTLAEHHAEVARRAGGFATPWAPLTGALLGGAHDIGKTSDSFQARLHGKHGKVDHTSAAWLYLRQQWGADTSGLKMAWLLAYPLLGHHGGMADLGSQADSGTLAWRLSGDRINAVPDWKPEQAAALSPAGGYFQELRRLMSKDGKTLDAFATAFLLRMLYSCLVDADYLDTERVCAPERHALRQEPPTLAGLAERFFHFLGERGFLPETAVSEAALAAGAQTACGSLARRAAIRQARAFMLQCCLNAAEERPGIFSLTMPTGGGKTLSSMAFALRHARKHGLRRIVLVVPYTSIIEQNADVLREALGEDAVLEHHSNFIHPDEAGAEGAQGDESASMAYRLTTENWDASVIVTTSVQFFESLFSNRPSRCRKLHNLAESVIILDEVQMLPVPFVTPCIAALRELARSYGSSVVLCTATQPALMRAPWLQTGLAPEEVRDIIPEKAQGPLFRIFERAQVEVRKEKLDDEALAAMLRAEPQVLCIVNSRRHARELFALLDGGEADFHLSARMTPAHRTRVLDTIRERLAAGLPCRVVSTSLIECGVDISFPVVLREKNGLDVLAQSAGRCNREGRDASGRVICFTSAQDGPKRAAELNRRCAAFEQVAEAVDLFCPETVRRYFARLYAASDLDEKGILGMTGINKESDEGYWRFQFATIAEEFRFIDEDTVSVVIEQGEAKELLAGADRWDRPSPAVLRKLQRHSVSVYTHELDRMQAQGRLETKFGFLPVLSGGAGYSEKTGLDVTLEEGLPVDDLLF
ncbi:MAG: CRISPR-associated helicase Cas3' [Desulfovibrio sp.]|uniref:CRISPR-associated helicase Cas3' n=1 Tax=Desulfovibrio sp. TaxID=885 RepID=UPI001A69AA4A|nr:CRISPR-associated helicase Cas3' [Desulfovibrio sp.]MBD5418195.1 CRISPR-associated helicase Cas3' [Desulfovibrio sp.]